MSLTNPDKLVTEERLNEYHNTILPYLGGMPDILANKFSRGDMYSTDEKMIGQWIDGKPIYQKNITYNVVNCVPNQYTTVTSVASLNIDSLISARFRKWYGDGDSTSGFINPFNYSVENNDLVVYMIGANDRTNSCIIQYTKTTDSPVAIGIDTDYSTEEKIIGTWIDGKPIYQKTIYISAFGNRTTLEIDTGIVNFDRLIDIEASVFDLDTYYGVGYTNNTYPNYSIAGISVTNAGMLKIDNREQNMSNCNGYITLKYTKTTD